MENCVIPINPDAQQSLHIDAVLFSKYIEQKFKNQLTIIDDEIVSVQVVNNHISELVLKTKGTVKADFYIDATGFNSMLMKSLNNTWIDKTDWMPIDSCIPNPVETQFTKQPCCTTSEASPDGWILQVPLSNRWGAGYLYSSQFTKDEQAFDKFSTFVKQTYNKELANTSKVLKFKSGYWKNQWVGNCIVVGLASGFSEPLEATNIHHTVEQVDQFVHVCSLQYCNYDITNYNKFMEDFYENVYLYLRFCYTTGRTDSEFWKYMTYNVPPSVRDLEEKIKFDFINVYDLYGPIFSFGNFTRVAIGQNKCDNNSIKQILTQRGLLDRAKMHSDRLNAKKLHDIKNVIDHRSYINLVKEKY
jgi:tryptophan halogenase